MVVMTVLLSIGVIALAALWFYWMLRLFLLGLKMLRAMWQLEKRYPGITARSVGPPQPSPLPWLGAGFLLGRWWHR